MSRRIAAHVVAGILFAGLGTSDAQESVPRPAVVEARDVQLDYIAGIEGDVGVTVAMAPNNHVDDTSENIEVRPSSDRLPQDASDSPRAKAGPTRRRFAGATRRMLEIGRSVCLAVGAGDEGRH